MQQIWYIKTYSIYVKNKKYKKSRITKQDIQNYKGVYRVLQDGTIINISKKTNILNKLKFLFVQTVLILFLGIFLFFNTNNCELNDVNSIKQIKNDIDFYKNILYIDSVREQNISKIKLNAKSYTNTETKEFNELANLIYNMTIKYPNLNVDLICSFIQHESGWKDCAVSQANAKGLMQIINSTASFLLATSNKYDNLILTKSRIDSLLLDPHVNVELGCSYLSGLIDVYGLNGGIVGYNAGPKWANLYVKSKQTTLPKETQKYLPNILNSYSDMQNMTIDGNL